MFAIEARDLVKVYSGNVVALNGVDLRVEEGASHAILGPNGAGKTTFIRIITTQIKPTSGSAKVFGYDVASHAASVRRLIGYVPQEMSLWTDLTGYENMLIYSKIYGLEPGSRRKVIEELLELMELNDASRRLVKTYSGGMIRRLEIAIALMSRPRLLILDEPTIGLDPRARMMVWEKLLAYKKESNTTIFFATHYMDEADKYADRVTLIDKGKIVAEGAPRELKASLGSDKVIIKVQGNTNEARAYLLDNGYSVETNGNGELIIAAENPAHVLPRVIEGLYSRGVVVLEARAVEATLDDVFIKLTGRRISEDEHGRVREVLSTRRAIRRGS